MKQREYKGRKLRFTEIAYINFLIIFYDINLISKRAL